MAHRNPWTGKRVRIVRTPDVLGGEPRVDGAINGRMPTRMVWEMVRDGRDYDYIFENYRITRWETDAAVAYENRLHRRIGRRVEAAKRALCVRWGYCDE